MRLLILGGTLFLGRHVAAAALQRGHAVTLFHRGEHPATGLEGAEELLGDRTGDLGALEGRSWDAAIDTSGYDPDVVARSATALAGCHYTFVSSISAYRDLERPGLTEDAEPADDDEYGGRKARCEAVLREPALIVRPGLIVGPSRSDRPLHLLGAPRRPGRRRPRPRGAGARGPAHRRRATWPRGCWTWWSGGPPAPSTRPVRRAR